VEIDWVTMAEKCKGDARNDELMGL
jgi:hypothetical protein